MTIDPYDYIETGLVADFEAKLYEEAVGEND